ncbi:hypothetical protein DV738_g3046, partial [Chaetothyriales sp. CBS 135597]
MALSGLNSPVSRARSPVGAGSKRTHILNATGILSDMDGTLIDSTEAIVQHWKRVGEIYNIDPKTILKNSHGRRSIDVYKQIDPAKATWDYVIELERQVPERWGDSASAIPGAHELLESLESLQAKWAIVTSGTRPLVEGWLKRLNLVAPENMVTAETVVNGKPDPEGYQLGATKLGLGEDTKSVLVLEDAPAGVRAGKAAGCMVLGLATSHSVQDIKDAGADWVVRDLKSVKVQRDPFVSDRLEVQLGDLLD